MFPNKSSNARDQAFFGHKFESSSRDDYAPKKAGILDSGLVDHEMVGGAAMHRNRQPDSSV
jgi:hypothetical protein